MHGNYGIQHFDIYVISGFNHTNKQHILQKGMSGFKEAMPPSDRYVAYWFHGQGADVESYQMHAPLLQPLHRCICIGTNCGEFSDLFIRQKIAVPASQP